MLSLKFTKIQTGRYIYKAKEVSAEEVVINQQTSPVATTTRKRKSRWRNWKLKAQLGNPIVGSCLFHLVRSLLGQPGSFLYNLPILNN
ncbi:hypothetical protein H5410_030069 [Solanum commersonii]|uniref:Uncharacterized protein n=1 Tax=Solanum commersonii TaxID=4109 RepID=A0A9J5YD78_SOLCO|nr:hypothetical protein H5410_030069 [Solanum commersonii]